MGRGRPTELHDQEGREPARRPGAGRRGWIRTPGPSTGRCPDEPQRKLDLFRFSLSLPGLARAVDGVLDGAFGGDARLVDPDRRRAFSSTRSFRRPIAARAWS